MKVNVGDVNTDGCKHMYMYITPPVVYVVSNAIPLLTPLHTPAELTSAHRPFLNRLSWLGEDFPRTPSGRSGRAVKRAVERAVFARTVFARTFPFYRSGTDARRENSLAGPPEEKRDGETVLY